MCQYDRNLGVDTVWSVIYDVKNIRIFRVREIRHAKNLWKIAE